MSPAERLEAAQERKRAAIAAINDALTELCVADRALVAAERAIRDFDGSTGADPGDPLAAGVAFSRDDTAPAASFVTDSPAGCSPTPARVAEAPAAETFNRSAIQAAAGAESFGQSGTLAEDDHPGTILARKHAAEVFDRPDYRGPLG